MSEDRACHWCERELTTHAYQIENKNLLCGNCIPKWIVAHPNSGLCVVMFAQPKDYFYKYEKA